MEPPTSPLHIVSIVIRVLALAWSIAVVRRVRDWRVATLTALLTLMVASEGVLLMGQAHAWSVTTLLRVAELPNLFVSVLALLAVVVSGRVLGAYRRVEQALIVEKAHLEELFESAPQATVLADNDSRIIRVNSEFTRLFGYTQQEAVGQSLDDLVAPGERLAEAREITRAVAAGGRIARETVRRRRDGSLVAVSILGAPVHVGGGQVAVFGIYRDITERKQAEEALRISEEKFSKAFRLSPDILTLSTIDDGILLDVNDTFVTATGYAREEVIGRSVHQLNLWNDLAERQVMVDRLKRHGVARNLEFSFRIKSGDIRIGLLSAEIIPIGGRPYMLTVSNDITERKAAEQALKASQERYAHEAIHDVLTGLPNRALFMDLLSRSVARSKRRKGYLFGVLFLDLDRFKIVNDSLGHLIGDQLLVGIARRLEKCLRPEDTVARLGGDEFTVLLDDINDASDATRVAERVHKELESPFPIGGREVFTTVSIGIALSATGYETADQILRDADTAMYRAKALGRARHEVFDAGMHTRAVAQLQLETDLRRAIEGHEFRLYYQPIVTLAGGRIVGFEALVRWEHPQRGLLLPSEFVPTAEETGLILPVGSWILEEACRAAGAWSDRFGRPFVIAVNLSNRQFGQPDLPERVAAVLHQTELPADRLKLEITESVIMEHGEGVTHTLHRLRELGVDLYVDDFGTGYSSFSVLHRFPISTLKIDGSFVRALGNGDGVEIVRTILTLAKNMKLNVIAEGVETKAQVQRLKTLKCPQAQGSAFAGPVPADGITTLLSGPSR